MDESLSSQLSILFHSKQLFVNIYIYTFIYHLIFVDFSLSNLIEEIECWLGTQLLMMNLLVSNQGPINIKQTFISMLVRSHYINTNELLVASTTSFYVALPHSKLLNVDSVVNSESRGNVM